MSVCRIATSPFNCVWIAKDSVDGIRGCGYAICSRTPGQPRVVAEEACARCAFWRDPEPPADESALRAA